MSVKTPAHLPLGLVGLTARMIRRPWIVLVMSQQIAVVVLVLKAKEGI